MKFLLLFVFGLPALGALPLMPPAAVVVPTGYTVTNAWQHPGVLHTSTNGSIWWKVGEGTNDGWNTNISKGIFPPCYIRVTSYYSTNVQEPGYDQFTINGFDRIYAFYSVIGPTVNGPWTNKTLVLVETNQDLLFSSHQIVTTNQINWTK